MWTRGMKGDRERVPWQECAQALGRPSSRNDGKGPDWFRSKLLTAAFCPVCRSSVGPGDAFELSEDTGCPLGKYALREQWALPRDVSGCHSIEGFATDVYRGQDQPNNLRCTGWSATASQAQTEKTTCPWGSLIPACRACPAPSAEMGG